MPPSVTDHPCLLCGACCAAFRVDFAVYEMEDMGGTVPRGLAVEVTGNTMRMRGTDHVPIRCAALVGKVGERASCGIYEWRPIAARTACHPERPVRLVAPAVRCPRGEACGGVCAAVFARGVGWFQQRAKILEA